MSNKIYKRDEVIKAREKQAKLNKIGWIGTAIIFGVLGIMLLIVYIVDDSDSNSEVLGTYHAFSSANGLRYTIVLKEDNQCTYTTLYTQSSSAVPYTRNCTYSVNGLNLTIEVSNKVLSEGDEPYSTLYYTFADSFVSFKQDTDLTYLKDLDEKD